MKNKNLIKQILFIGLIAAVSWVFGYWLDVFDCNYLWLISFPFIIIIAPILYIQHKRIKQEKSVKKINMVFNIAILLFIFIFFALLIDPVFSYIKLLFSNSEFSWLENIKIFLLSGDKLFDLTYVLSSILRNLPGIMIIVLLFLMIRENKKIKINS